MPKGKYFDDLPLGYKDTTMGRTITETDLVNWLALTGLCGEMFRNRELSRDQGLYDKPMVPALFTESLADGLTSLTQVLQGTSLAFLNGQTRAIAPVFIGDTIKDEYEVISKKLTSKPDRGVVTFLHTVTNQHGRAVLSFTHAFMMRRRPDLIEAED